MWIGYGICEKISAPNRLQNVHIRTRLLRSRTENIPCISNIGATPSVFPLDVFFYFIECSSVFFLAV